MGAMTEEGLKALGVRLHELRHIPDRELLVAIYERTAKMLTIDDLNAAVDKISTAVNDASNAIKDEAQKLASASSLNPADVETAANRLSALADGLQATVKAAGEPITAAPAPAPSPEPAPAATAQGTAPSA